MARLRNSSSVTVELSQLLKYHASASRDPDRSPELRSFHKVQTKIIREKLSRRKGPTKADLRKATEWKTFCQIFLTATREERAHLLYNSLPAS